MMKRYVLILAVLSLLIAGCGQGEPLVNKSLNLSNQSVNDTVNDTRTNLTEGGEARENLSKEGIKELSSEERLEQLKEEQKEIFRERSEVLKRMREVLDIMNSDNTSFEDRQFYEKAYAILKDRKSSLTLEATLLESRINYLEEKVDTDQTLSEVRARLEELREEEEQYKKQLRELGEKIVNVRQEWMESYNESLQEELKQLESEENEILQDLNSVREEISDKEETIEELNVSEPKKGYRDVLLELQGVREEISVVRNKLVQKYTELSDANETRTQEIRDEINELEDKEDELEDRLNELEEQLKDY